MAHGFERGYRLGRSAIQERRRERLTRGRGEALRLGRREGQIVHIIVIVFVVLEVDHCRDGT